MFTSDQSEVQYKENDCPFTSDRFEVSKIKGDGHLYGTSETLGENVAFLIRGKESRLYQPI